MPPSKEELDRRLERYLDDRDDESRRGVTIGAVHASVRHVVDWTQAHEKKDDTRHEELARKFEALERAHIEERVTTRARLDRHESDIKELKPEVRKSAESLHDITEQDLADKLAEEKAAHNKKVERFWQVVMAIIILVATALVGTQLAKLGIKVGQKEVTWTSRIS